MILAATLRGLQTAHTIIPSLELRELEVRGSEQFAKRQTANWREIRVSEFLLQIISTI